MRYLLLALLLTAGPLRAEDWPQWLGPTRDGVSKETVSAWKGTPFEHWKVQVGDGHSSPVVADGKVYLFSMVPSDMSQKEKVELYDAESGATRGSFSYDKDKFTSQFGNGPRSTPVVEKGNVYTLGNTGHLKGTSKTPQETKFLFDNDTLKTYGAKNLFFGVSASPLIAENLVIVPVGGAGHGIVAFDKTNGNEAWKALDDAASYAAPVYKNGQIIALTGANAVGLSLKGELLWKYPFKDLLNESSTTPVVIDDKVIVSSVTAGSVCLEIKQADGKWTAKELWKKPELSCYFSTPLVISKELMLMVNGEVGFRPKNAKLRCVEIATGKIVWERENIGKYHASLIKLADGKVLGFDDNGYLFLLDNCAKEYKELCRSRLFEAKGNAWAHPALSNGRLFVRSATELHAFEMK